MKSTRERERVCAHATVHAFSVPSRSHAFQLRRWKEKSGTAEERRSKGRAAKKKGNPQRRGCKEGERDKARREREVVNEDCIAVATWLIGFHFVFLPCRLSASLSLLFSPLMFDVVLMAPPGYKAIGYTRSVHTHSLWVFQHSSGKRLESNMWPRPLLHACVLRTFKSITAVPVAASSSSFLL